MRCFSLDKPLIARDKRAAQPLCAALFLAMAMSTPLASAQETGVWKSLSDYLPEAELAGREGAQNGNSNIIIRNQDLAARLQTTKLALDKAARIKGGDTLSITIKNVESLSGPYTVDAGGYVKMPYIEAVNVAGLSEAQIAATLTALYRDDLLRDPVISVTSQSQNLGKVLISGAVNTAGVFEITRYKQLTDIVRLGNGLTRDANKQNFVVFRVENGQRKIYGVDYQAVIDGQQYDPVIGPQDIIYVPKMDEPLDAKSLKASLNVLDLALDLAVK